MKKLLKIALLSSAIAASSAVFADDKSTTKLTDSSIIAEYDGTKVTLKEVLGQFKELFENQPAMKGRKFEELDKSIQDSIVKGFVNSKIIDAEAKAAKISESRDFADKLEQVKAQLAQQIYVDQKIKSLVTDDKVKTEYEKFKKEMSGKEEVKASHILVQNEDTAKEIKEKLSKGAKFADLVKEYSIDEGSKANGGEIGYFQKGQLVPEFEKAAYAMKKGEVSVPVKTQFGWHIIKVEDKRAVKVPSLEEIKDNIQGKLQKDAFDKFMAELAEKHKVKFNI